MKHHYTQDAIRRRNQNLPHKPLRTASEMAAEFNISQQKLSAYMRMSESAPKPRIPRSDSGLTMKAWYDPDEMRAWWKKHQPKVGGI